VSRVSERILVLDGSTSPDREVVGGKAASIARMRALGLPVPPAFVLPIEECRRYQAGDGTLDDAVWQAVLDGVAMIERDTGRRLGDPEAPLLVSVRSGAAVSMPGMMDTILNLGMTDAAEAGLARLSGAADFARQTHVRFVHEFGHTVLGADIDPPAANATADEIRAQVRDDAGADVPAEPLDQLRAAILTVFRSWSARRAVAYRRHWGIPEDGGTAVVTQAMVFGNLAEDSGTGVLFTRNPLDGSPEPFGDWLPGGQGEDVVAGTHDPLQLSALGEQLPEAHEQLLEAGRLLERENGDVQDIEFTVEAKRLYLLQSRAAKRSPLAAVRTAVDLAEEGTIDRVTALARVTPEQLERVLAPLLPEEVTAGAEVLAKGTPACPGIASGRVVASSADAEVADDDVVLARPTTSPEDVAGMIAAVAVVTERGGATSHAAVVTRALGRPSVVGLGDGITAGWHDRAVTVDGSRGVVYAGRLTTAEVPIDNVPGLARLLGWARESVAAEVAESGSGDVLDLDETGLTVAADASPDIEALVARMEGARAVRGSIVSTPEGAAAVVRSGVPTVVALPGQHTATLLLRLAHARQT